MTHALRTLLSATILIMGVQAAHAACYADYKAKQDSPLRLHYGVIELPDSACGSKAAAGNQIAQRIGRDGWKLLNVMSLFDQGGLKERRESAGAYYLRY